MNKTYERAVQFMNNMSKKRVGISNVYVFTSVDKDGNIVDEKYGMNLMTNSGFSEIYTNGVSFNARSTSGNTVQLYVGTGVGETPYSTSDTDLESIAFNGLAATFTTTNDTFVKVDGTAKAYNYPIYFSKGEHDGEGFITLISRFLVAYYDYNISNFPGEYYISEYGIKHNNILWTHSRIYDVNGDPASIRKTSNERLYITVYMCLSFYENIIMNGWNSNRFLMITRNDMMYNRMTWNSRVKLYKRGDRTIDITDGGCTRTQSALQNGLTNSTVGPRVIMHDSNSDAYNTETKIFTGGYFDGFILSEDGFMCIEPQFMSTAENVELTNYLSNDPTISSGFSDKFGVNPSSGYSNQQYPQMTHFFNAKAYLFDWKNADWTCELDIYNPDSKWYDETSMAPSCCLPVYYFNNGEMLTGYVYQNLRTDDKITEILSGASTVYATNKYWAGSNDQNNQDPDKGWVWIRDYANIPVACQSARYWITNNNVGGLSFKRESGTFELLEKGTQSNGYEYYPEYSQEYYIKPICDNYAYGWYKRGNKVYVPSVSARPTYTVGNDSDENMTYGKWLITFPSSNNTITSVNMSQATSGTVTPHNLTTPFTGTVDSLTQTHRTETGTGIICLESTNTEETVIIDLRGNSVSMSVHGWKHACCIWGTNKVAYINAGTTDKNVYIFNFDTNQNEGVPIAFPTGLTDIAHIFGHTNYLWMTDGSTYGYVCDLRTPATRNLVGFAYSGLYGSDLNYIKYACLDDVFIVYKYNECGKYDIPLAHYIKLSDPTNPVGMDDFTSTSMNGSIGGNIIYDLRYVNKHTSQLGTTSEAMVLTIMRGWINANYVTPNGCECRVFDFGQYLHTGDVVCQDVSADIGFGNLCFFGENVIYRYTYKMPLINYLPIKLTGKTDTINSMAYIKSITSKSWLIGFTNTPSWGDGSSNPSGKPPGTPLAVTDNTGTITGWS